MSLEETIKRREDVTERIVQHCRTDTKQTAIVMITGHMSLDDLEALAKFWDERLSPEEITAIAKQPTVR